MNATLRPMNLGEILDRTFEVYRKRFLLFVEIAALPALAMLCVHLADVVWWHLGKPGSPFFQYDIFWRRILLWIGFEHVRALLTIPFLPALTNSASKAIFGKPDSPVESLRVIAVRLRSYFWIGFLKLVAVMVIPEAMAAGMLFVGAYAETAAGFFKYGPNLPYTVLTCFPVGTFAFLFLWFGAAFSLAFPVAVIEDKVGIKAMRRSWKLSKNSRGRIILAWFTVAIANWVLMGGLQTLFRLAMIAGFGPHLGSTYLAGVYAINAIVIALLGPLYPVAVTLIYYDQRIRREGYDIEMLMEVAGLDEPALPVEPEPSVVAE